MGLRLIKRWGGNPYWVFLFFFFAVPCVIIIYHHQIKNPWFAIKPSRKWAVLALIKPWSFGSPRGGEGEEFYLGGPGGGPGLYPGKFGGGVMVDRKDAWEGKGDWRVFPMPEAVRPRKRVRVRGEVGFFSWLRMYNQECCFFFFLCSISLN